MYLYRWQWERGWRRCRGRRPQRPRPRRARGAGARSPPPPAGEHLARVSVMVRRSGVVVTSAVNEGCRSIHIAQRRPRTFSFFGHCGSSRTFVDASSLVVTRHHHDGHAEVRHGQRQQQQVGGLAQGAVTHHGEHNLGGCLHNVYSCCGVLINIYTWFIQHTRRFPRTDMTIIAAITHICNIIVPDILKWLTHSLYWRGQEDLSHESQNN